jgi:sulfite reductase (NADPH) flavoprotein alpha-component
MANTDSQVVPCLPECAPFTPEQRAYLNGFLAGLFSRTPLQNTAAAPPAPLTPISILFGSQTGNAENLAKRAAKEASKRGFAPTVHDLANYPVAQLPSEKRVLLISSTYGDGEPPDNAKGFWKSLNDSSTPRLPETQFSVCALGDSNYPKFCAFGKDLDMRLDSLGAKRVHACAECDVEFDEPFSKWLNEALASIGPASKDIASPHHGTPAEPPPGNAHQGSTFSRANPFPAPLVVNQKLNGLGSGKDTRHFEFDLDSSGLDYEPGDVLGVVPSNCPHLVGEILTALNLSGEEGVSCGGSDVPLREALQKHYEITRISPQFLAAMAQRSGDQKLTALSAPGVNGELTTFLRGREIIDLLLAHRTVRFDAAEFVTFLKKLQPRLYSISSSPKAHPGRVNLTVSVVRYDSLSRERKGVCSTFLSDRVTLGEPAPVFVHKNKNFRPPSNGDTPMIMVGPGTGIAPFRAFLEERRASGARGRNWLFFGDQKASTDFLYRDELGLMLRDGSLSRLDTAFSRDQADKIYVQNRMREHPRELYSWLEAGAHFYVCGDASRMARDVDTALHEIIQQERSCSLDQACEYVNRLKAEKRYQRDVY